ncbi:MAG: lipopolysaccharide transport periplasmic protein LptA [Candidatus Rokuibacteriota bacterium]
MNRRAAVITVFTVAICLAGAGISAQPRTPAPKPRPGGTKAPEAKPGVASSADRKPGQRSNSPIVIDADRMEAIKKEGLVIFTGSVVAKQDNSTQTADRMEVYLDDKGERVLRMVSTGNVKIVTEDCRTGTARRAEYYDDEQRLLLIGNAKVWQDENVVTGDEIEIFLSEDRSIVKGGSRERVKSLFYPKREETGQDATAAAKKEEKRAPSCG